MSEAPEYVRPLVTIIIAAIAQECNRQPEELTQGLHHMLQKFGEQCFEQGVEWAHDRPTLETPVIEPEAPTKPVRKVRESTLPLGITRKK